MRGRRSPGRYRRLLITAALASVLGGERLRGAEPSQQSSTIKDAGTRTTQPARPGARVRLGIEDGWPEGTRFRWIQVEGPSLAIEDATRSVVEVTIPKDARRLGLVFIFAQGEDVQLVRVIVPIKAEEGDGAALAEFPGAPAPGRLKADAGDDQAGLVGHRVTLNGSRSVPSDGAAARWVQVAGPAASDPEQQGAYFSFVPTAPGTYKFLLVVGGDGSISEPDEVSVLVGVPPSATAANPSPSPMPAPAPQPAAAPAPTMEQLLSSVVARMPDGPRVASDVADVLESVAQRSALYSTFASLQNELGRRLDVVVPTEPATRDAWTRSIFTPLTSVTAAELAAAGLDLRGPQAATQPLNEAQRDRLRAHFQSLARAFRAGSRTR